MESYTLLENPRKRTKSGRFTKKRRNPTRRKASTTTTKANPRRRRRRKTTTVARRRRRAPVRRRRRRRNPSRGGRIMSMPRIMGVLTDGAGMAVAEIGGDMVARFIVKNTPIENMLGALNLDANGVRAATQIVVGLVGEPMLRQVRILPKAVMKNFGTVNVASGILALANNWRQTLLAQTGLNDWVAVGPGPMTRALPPPGNISRGMSDWDTVGSSHNGDYFSQ